jgi:uncharacterized protein YceK
MIIKLLTLAAFLLMAGCASQEASRKDAQNSESQAKSAYQDMDKEMGKTDKDTLQ